MILPSDFVRPRPKLQHYHYFSQLRIKIQIIVYQVAVADAQHILQVNVAVDARLKVDAFQNWDFGLRNYQNVCK